MPYDPSKPVENTPLDAAEMRDQLVAQVEECHHGLEVRHQQQTIAEIEGARPANAVFNVVQWLAVQSEVLDTRVRPAFTDHQHRF
ncbi:MAG: hypothetical protein ABL949_17305, partial [Fimbriimonadaceae bacterium]